MVITYNLCILHSYIVLANHAMIVWMLARMFVQINLIALLYHGWLVHYNNFIVYTQSYTAIISSHNSLWLYYINRPATYYF